MNQQRSRHFRDAEDAAEVVCDSNLMDLLLPKSLKFLLGCSLFRAISIDSLEENIFSSLLQPNLRRVENFTQAVGSYEDQIFQKRAWLHQRQAERTKREKGWMKRGDDAQPQAEPESLVLVSRYHGSRLALTLGPSPFQRGATDGAGNGAYSGIEAASYARAPKVPRLSATATIGTAIVAVESSLEMEVCVFCMLL